MTEQEQTQHMVATALALTDGREAPKKIREAMIFKSMFKHGQSMTAQDISDETGIPYVTVTRIVRDLEQDGVITKASNSKGKTIRWILTGKVTDELRMLIGDELILYKLDAPNYRMAQTLTLKNSSATLVELALALPNARKPVQAIYLVGKALNHLAVRSLRALDKARQAHPGKGDSQLLNKVEEFLSEQNVYPPEALTKGVVLMARRELLGWVKMLDELIDTPALWNGQAFLFTDQIIPEGTMDQMINASDEFQRAYLMYEQTKDIFAYFNPQVVPPTNEEEETETDSEDNEENGGEVEG